MSSFSRVVSQRWARAQMCPARVLVEGRELGRRGAGLVYGELGHHPRCFCQCCAHSVKQLQFYFLTSCVAWEERYSFLPYSGGALS